TTPSFGADHRGRYVKRRHAPRKPACVHTVRSRGNSIMEFFVTSASPSRQRTDCAIVGIYEKGTLSAAAEDLDSKLGGRIAKLAKRGDLRGKPGDSLLLADVTGVAGERVRLVGLGARGKLTRKQYRKAISGALATLGKTGARNAVSYLSLESVKDTDVYT